MSALERRLTREELEHIAVRAAELGKQDDELVCDLLSNCMLFGDTFDTKDQEADLAERYEAWLWVGANTGWRRRMR